VLSQAVDRKRCASCDRWRGERRAGSDGRQVEIESELSSGLCCGGPWDNSERRARSACGHWLRWQQLPASE